MSRPRPSRHADDRMERIEWQLNEIRHAVSILAVLAVLGVLGSFLLAVAASGS